MNHPVYLFSTVPITLHYLSVPVFQTRADRRPGALRTAGDGRERDEANGGLSVHHGAAVRAAQVPRPVRPLQQRAEPALGHGWLPIRALPAAPVRRRSQLTARHRPPEVGEVTVLYLLCT